MRLKSGAELNAIPPPPPHRTETCLLEVEGSGTGWVKLRTSLMSAKPVNGAIVAT